MSVDVRSVYVVEYLLRCCFVFGFRLSVINRDKRGIG